MSNAFRDKLPLSGKIKMSDLMNRNLSLPGVLGRVGLSFGFGDESVEDVCRKGGVDTDTFLLICSVYLYDSYKPSKDILSRVDLHEIVAYLRNSHRYYMEDAMQTLSDDLDRVLEPCSDKEKNIILHFLSDYKDELGKHFDYEENMVFPYVDSVLAENGDDEFSIDQYEESHSNVQEKLQDLKRLIMTYLPAQCEQQMIQRVLYDIFMLETDLSKHTSIEDDILIPAVGHLEDLRPSNSEEELSAREKEILVGVARGMLNKEIADKYNLSIHTVISHRKNITRKTGIKTVAGLTVYALLGGLIDIDSIE